MTMVEQAGERRRVHRVYETVRDHPLFMHYHRGWFNLGIDAVTHETLFDESGSVIPRAGGGSRTGLLTSPPERAMTPGWHPVRGHALPGTG